MTEPSGRPTIAFDLDGTLSDWEAAIRLAEPEHADRLLEVLDGRHPRDGGQMVDGAHYLLFVVGPEIWAEVLGAVDGADAASARFEASFRAVPFAEVDAVLAELADRFRLALVTNSPRARAALADMGLPEHFDAVVEIPPDLRKPKPEGFWHAAEELGVEPADLVYVGDSYRFDVVAVLTPRVPPSSPHLPATTLPVPDGVERITDLSALPAVLA